MSQSPVAAADQDPFFSQSKRNFLALVAGGVGLVVTEAVLSGCDTLSGRTYNDDPLGITLAHEDIPEDTRPLNSLPMLSPDLQPDPNARATADRIQDARARRAHTLASEIYRDYREDNSSQPDTDRATITNVTTAADGHQVVEFIGTGGTGDTWVSTAVFRMGEGGKPDLGNLEAVRVQLRGRSAQDPVRVLEFAAADHADGSRTWNVNIQNPGELPWYQLPPELADNVCDNMDELNRLDVIDEQLLRPAISRTNPGEFRAE